MIKKVKNLIMNILVFYVILILCVSNINASVVEYPETLKQLPLPYKSLTSDEMKEATFVHERFYTVLTQEPQKKHAIVGPLVSCFLVGLKNEANGKTVVFHKQSANSIDSLISIAKDELSWDGTNPEHIINGHILVSNMKEDYNDPSKGVGGRSWQELYNGNTQKQELKLIKNSIIKAFNLLTSGDDNKIKTDRLTSQFTLDAVSNDLGEYVTANMCILVDNELNMNSFSYVKEGFFVGDSSPVPSSINNDLPRLLRHFELNENDFIQKLFALKKIPPSLQFLNALQIAFLMYPVTTSTMIATVSNELRYMHFNTQIRLCFKPDESQMTDYNSLSFRSSPSNSEYNVFWNFLSKFSSFVQLNEELLNLPSEALRSYEVRAEIYKKITGQEYRES